MRVARLLLSTRSRYDLKCFRLDREASSPGLERAWSLPGSGASDAGLDPRTETEVARELRSFSPDILHVYGSGAVPHPVLAATGSAPWLADRNLIASRPLFGRRPRAQARILADHVLEPVADDYFSPRLPRPVPLQPTLGSFRHSSRQTAARDLVDARIRRFRDDLRWVFFDAPPAAAEMSTLDLWVDLANDDDELDGMVCEAIALGLPVVATRTTANRRRTLDGRAAVLCPCGDPNEMAHAIVTMLFKPERVVPLLTAALEFRVHFRKETRMQALRAAYTEVVG